MELKIWNNDHLTALAVRMKKGDRKAAATLYDELGPKAFGFFYARTGKREVAEDLSQDMFIRLVEKIETFDEKRSRFVVWFWTVARNMLIDHYRAKKEVPFSMFEETELESMSVVEMPNMDGRLEYRKVQEFLHTLGADDKELFELRFVADISYKDLSTMLGKSEGALRVASLRIKEKIKHEFHHED
jgi:RNA polymerase sigma-70 factor (ECF subfamily)